MDDRNAYMPKMPLPVEIVLAPEWWHRHAGIDFDRDFFFHPARRVEDEQRMERVLYERWGHRGLGAHRDEARPEVGAVHLAAGFLLSEMLGCEVTYREDAPPQVHPAEREDLALDPDDAFRSDAFRRFEALLEGLRTARGGLTGDVNWGGVLNLAMDLRGEEIFLDMLDEPEAASGFFHNLAAVIDRFVRGVERETGTSSVSVNRTVAHFDRPVFLHSECSHTMIGTDPYDALLRPFDEAWSRARRPFGIHYCGNDPHRYATSFAALPHLDFLDVGWGGDLRVLREALPETFLNIRLSPVELVDWSPDRIHAEVGRLLDDAGDPWRTGVCCINLDDRIADDQVDAIFDAVAGRRDAALAEAKA